jgi:hypothetical protein
VEKQKQSDCNAGDSVKKPGPHALAAFVHRPPPQLRGAGQGVLKNPTAARNSAREDYSTPLLVKQP